VPQQVGFALVYAGHLVVETRFENRISQNTRMMMLYVPAQVGPIFLRTHGLRELLHLAHMAVLGAGVNNIELNRRLINENPYGKRM
jgi:hypothetical protein